MFEADAEAIHAAYEDRFHSAEEELSNLRNLVVRADSIWEDAGGPPSRIR